MANRLTRRQIATAIAAAPLLAQTPAPKGAQAPAPPKDTQPAVQASVDPVQKARDQYRRNAEALNKVQLEMAVEPSFAFKP